MYVSLSSLPSARKEYVVDFPRLDGGLNNWELDYRLDANESPEMRNLIWKDGALCCRDGQTRLTAETPGTGWSAYERPFWDHGFFHIGDSLYCLPLTNPEADAETLSYTQVLSGVPENRGSWFVYEGSLFYKNRGGYFQIDYQEDGTFTAGAVKPYAPITYINMEPTTHAGDEYQPANRLCPTQTVWYSVVEGVKEYHLPVTALDSVDKVVVDGVELVEDTGYTVDLTKGLVVFTTEPTHHDPFVANTVQITFTKSNPGAYNSIMDCPYAVAFGGDQNLCVVVGGCSAQPNAYFWCGNHVVMDPGYFPMEQYNLAGATEESITGFGLQQNLLVIFKERSIGRAEFGTTEMATGRVMLTMDYTNINSRIGCNLPWTIQLVENNLVFCNTEQGVHVVLDSSSAYENNVALLSRKVNNTLLKAARRAAVACSFDDGERYWVVLDEEVYAWDYALSSYKNPSWFYFVGIKGVAFLTAAGAKYHLSAEGYLSIMRRGFTDYGEAIHKVYRFATQHMGSYDRLKDVVGVTFVVRGDTNTCIRVFYSTDHEFREDKTPIKAYTRQLAPRDLSFRCLAVLRFAFVARRRPGCRHVRHFNMRLENNEPGTDMSVISAQIYYKFTGRDR